MGIFDEAEKLVGQAGGDQVVQDLTQEAEKYADEKTGGQFDSEIQDAGNALDQQIDKEI
jgi:hypothetical protein